MSEESTPPRTIDLSVPQLVGGSVAAATAAALSTRLGLVGTIAGAVVASVVSAVVAASVSGWLHRAGRLARDREPTRIRSVVIGLAAVALVAFAFHTGLSLVSDLPRDAFVARWLAQLDVDVS